MFKHALSDYIAVHMFKYKQMPSPQIVMMCGKNNVRQTLIYRCIESSYI